MSIFEQASRGKLRFSFKGSLSIEDLWDLNLPDLDKIFKGLNAKAKICKEESLLGPKGSENAELDLQIAIVKRIAEVKIAEDAAREQEATKKAKRQKILTILAEKQDAGLVAKSEDDLRKMLEEL
jgi:hypothetical protein